jgi:hypothetical protein
VYAVGLNSIGRREDAMAALKANLVKHSADRDTLLALLAFSRDAGDIDGAIDYAERLAKLEPTDSNLPHLIEDLRSHATKPAGK